MKKAWSPRSSTRSSWKFKREKMMRSSMWRPRFWRFTMSRSLICLMDISISSKRCGIIGSRIMESPLGKKKMARLAFMAPLKNQSVTHRRCWRCLTREASIEPLLPLWWMNHHRDRMPSSPSSSNSIDTIKKNKASFLLSSSLLILLARKGPRKQEQRAPLSKKESASTLACLNSATSSLH